MSPAQTRRIALELARADGLVPPELEAVLSKLCLPKDAAKTMQLGSVIFANKPGDGSAREQAASCQRVLGGCANICYEFATKRYRSNCVNWGMLPFTLEPGTEFTAEPGDFIFVPDVKRKVDAGDECFPAKRCARERQRGSSDALAQKHIRRGARAAAARLPHEPLRRTEKGVSHGKNQDAKRHRGARRR